MLFEHHQ